MFIDLDDFKVVNDGLGHAAGDDLLCVVASRLRSSVRSGDLCARLGGDEFAVLMPHADDGADATGQRLVELVSTPVSLRGHLAQVGVSVGLTFATAGSTAELLMQQADVAMYAAKAKGKNRVQIFDPGLLQDSGHTAFESELATAADEGQLVVHYQPIMSVADGRCIAVEALVRWQHPARGLLGPAEFIPTAERTGAIIGIGAFVLRSACTAAAEWPSGLALHVNVSAAQLTDSGFLGMVRGCVAEFGLAPKQLVLEVTETMVLDSPAIRVALEALVAIDVSIAIDDFGTGYAALTTLHTLPLDIVKIDKSFILGDASRAADEAVVGGIVQMAARLSLQVIAEGVERLDQQAFVRTVGADAAQGYLYLRPSPAPAFAEWLMRQQQRTRPDATVTPIGRAGSWNTQ
jgi:diguanylate cyclase (GGDEF)-like protein